MTQKRFVDLLPRLYVAALSNLPGALPVLRIESRSPGADRLEYSIPAPESGMFLIRIHERDVALGFPQGASVDLHSFTLLDLRHLIWRRRSDYKARLEVPGRFSITPLLAANGKEGRELKKSLSILRKFGFAVSSENFQCTPGLFEAWPPEGAALPVYAPVPERAEGLPSFAVVLHLHYRDLWPEFAWCLGRFPFPFQLIVSTNEEDPAFEREVRRVFPNAEIHVVENRGRDVGPFMELLRQGHLDRFDAVCKLHGKRSAVSGPRALLGHIWRRANLIDLVGSDEQVAHILRRFADDPGIGMIGSSRFHFPNAHFGEEGVWGENRDTVFELIRRLGDDPSRQRPEYYAGTMFWVSGEMLAGLKRLDLSLQDFPSEHGALDGDLNHAMERLFGMLPAMLGLKLEDAPVAYDPPGLFPA